MSEAVTVVIIQKDNFSYSTGTNFEVIVKMTPEFMCEPKEIIPDLEKAEYVSQRVKEEMYKHLTRNIEVDES